MVDNGSDNFDFIVENYREICYNIENAKAKCGRESETVGIMAVTKTVAAEKVNAAVNCGITLLGENRVQEYLSKKDLYDSRAKVHMIGHLQTNKVKYIIGSVDMIESVDSIKLASEINRLSKARNLVTDLLVEVNIGDEGSKSGVKAEDAVELIKQASQLEAVRVKGLMAIPPINFDDDIYKRLQELFEKIKAENIPGVSMETLSVGMSGDYEKAVMYGSNLVRIGTKLFGARKYMEV